MPSEESHSWLAEAIKRIEEKLDRISETSAAHGAKVTNLETVSRKHDERIQILSEKVARILAWAIILGAAASIGGTALVHAFMGKP